MDLNQLLYHHQIAVMRAGSRKPNDREQRSLVDHYARRIRDRLAADAAPATPGIWTPVLQ